MANWQEPWAKASLRRVRSPAVRPFLSCADQTRIRPLKSDNVNGPRALATSHIRELWVTPDPPVAWMLMVGDLEKSLLSFLSQSSRMSVVVVDLRGAVMEGGGLCIWNPPGWAPLWEAQPTEWMEIILWVAYAYLTYHGCDMFVWVRRGVVHCIGESHDRRAKWETCSNTERDFRKSGWRKS